MAGKHPKPNLFVLWTMKITGWWSAMLYYKPKLYYMDRKQQGRRLKGACILMSNHTSFFDYPLHLALFPLRTIRFLMAEVLFRHSRLFSWFLYSLGGIYVSRGVMRKEPIDESVETLRRGGVVGIFPQGKLPVPGEPRPFKPGIVLIALQSGCPVIPIYTDGNYGLFKRTHIMMGTPIFLRDYCSTENPTKEQLQELTALLEEKMNEMEAALRQRTAKS